MNDENRGPLCWFIGTIVGMLAQIAIFVSFWYLIPAVVLTLWIALTDTRFMRGKW